MAEDNIKIPSELLFTYCKDTCMDQKQYHKEYYQKNKEKLLKQATEYQKNNKDKVKKWKDKYRETDKGKTKEKKYSKEYYEKNKDKIKEYDRERNIKNKEKNKERRIINKEKNSSYAKAYREKEENKEKSRTYQKEWARKKSLENLEFRIKKNLRSRVRTATIKKIGRTMDLVGCSIEELIQHIESKFQEGMSWNNYGKYGWHIDHIRPCASFNLLSEDEQRQCFHYTNLQPLWAFDNLSKKDKWIND